MSTSAPYGEDKDSRFVRNVGISNNKSKYCRKGLNWFFKE